MGVGFIIIDLSIAGIGFVTERERYDEAWATGDYDPIVGIFNVRQFFLRGMLNNYKRILDVGCGMGATVRYLRELGNLDTYGIDFAQPATEAWKRFDVDKYCCVASAEEIPFKDDTFDLVMCMDVLEHIPEENIKRVFREMHRIGGEDFLFIISLIEAATKMPDGSEPHICVKSIKWWVKRIQEAGFQIPNKVPYNHALCIRARKKSRIISPYAYKH